MTNPPVRLGVRLVGAAAIALGMVVAACSPLLVGGRNIDGSKWIATSIAGRTPVQGFEPTLMFDGGRISGSAGCNGYVGQEAVQIDGNRIALGEILSTAAGCLQADGSATPGMQIEPAFLSTLGAVDHIAFRDGDLVLSGGEDELVFAPMR
ncbi:MAG TPA: META domain-containing protein [Candidatus Limnocylindrales bacterium]|nr:META domain-containing protein [Candidatus Limnocylindrales bacterium]